MWLKVHFWRHAELLNYWYFTCNPSESSSQKNKHIFCKQSRKVGLLGWYSLMPDTHFISTTSSIRKVWKVIASFLGVRDPCYPCLIKGFFHSFTCALPTELIGSAIFFFPSFNFTTKKTRKFWRSAVAKQKGSLDTSYSRLFAVFFHRENLRIFQVMKGSEVLFIVSMEFHFETSGNFSYGPIGPYVMLFSGSWKYHLRR